MIQLDTLLYFKVSHICLLSHSRLAKSDKAMLGCLTGWWGRTQVESSTITQRHGDLPYGDGRVAGGVLWMIVTLHTSLMWRNGPWEVSCLGKNRHSNTKWSNHVLEAMSAESPWWREQREEKATEALRESSALTIISLITMLGKKPWRNTSLNLCFASIAAGFAKHRNPVKDPNVLKLRVTF